jgi:hypothetical protein
MCVAVIAVAWVASLLSTALAMVIWWFGWPLMLIAYIVGLTTGIAGLGERGFGRGRAIVCVVILGALGLYVAASIWSKAR